MHTQNILHKNYTLAQSFYQLKLPLNIDYIIPDNDSVRLLSQFVEEMNLSDLFTTYFRFRKNTATPRQMLKIMLYAYMNKIYSSRDIEKACHRDVNFMYLLEDSKAPDHATIARFRTLHFASISKKLLAEVSNFLYEIGEVSGETIFIDGTKIEANANKYTFVWKKAVTKNQAKLLIRLTAFVADCEEQYGIKVVYDNKVTLRHIKKLRKKLYRIKSEESIEFVHGIGRRKMPLQKSIEQIEGYIDKLKEYNKKIYNCGSRNSYSKTDHDATFMRMKEDAMLNGQLKPAYNLQHGVDSEYITWISIGPQPTDTTTLIPFLKEIEENLVFKYKNITADSGYESEENYLFIEKNEQVAFIKPANYEISKTRKYKTDISRRENMDYDEERDVYICKNQKELRVTGTKFEKTKTGYKREKTLYSCEDCKGCPYKTSCIKGNNSKIPMEERTKHLEVSKLFQKKRTEDLTRILSEEGCQLRMNRSIQAEGSFADTKEDMSFRRYLCRGGQNVLAESTLLAIAHNINKLHHKIQSEKTGQHLFELKKSA
jgi:transposase